MFYDMVRSHCVDHLPLQSFLSKEIAFRENPNEFLLLSVWLLNCDSDLTFGYYEEGIATGSLAYYIVTLLIMSFFQYIGYFDESVFL